MAFQKLQGNSPNNLRERIQILSRILREHGLVDRFGLSEVIKRDELPTKKGIEELLKSGSGPMPPTVKASFLATLIWNELKPVSNKKDSSAPACLLHKIKPGTVEAGKYHKNIFELLKWIFDDELFRGTVEQKVNDGRKRIDITFEKRGISGFFHDLETQHRVFCPKIFIECKNYDRDLKNPEFDQLIGRFHIKRGRFGILVCRKIKDVKKALKTCQDSLNAEQGYMIFLQDKDIHKLIALRKNDDNAGIGDLMAKKFDALIL